MRTWVALLLAACCLTGCQHASSQAVPPLSPPATAVDPFAGMQFDRPLPSPPSPAVEVDRTVPDFDLPGVLGPAHHLSDWRGRPTIVAFWAFWCTTWREVDQGFRHLADDKRCTLVTVDIDCQWKDQLPHQVPYVALMDPGSAVSHQWQVKAVPTIAVIDAHGVLRARLTGYPGDDVLRGWIDRLSTGGRI